MNLSFLRRISYLPLAMLFVTGTLLAVPPAPEPTTPMTDAALSALQRQASESLQQTKFLAVNLQRHADELKAVARANQVGWETHATYLNLAKQHINSMGEHLNWLHVMRHNVAPWQRQAIDRIFPAAVDLANRTDAAINHLSENKSRERLYNPDYHDHLSAIADRADELKTSLADFLKLGEAQEETSRLELKLEATAS